MTKIPETIRKAAEASYRESVKLCCGSVNLDDLSEYMAGYVQCWRDMMSGGADGWCAWYPAKGLIVDTTNTRRSEVELSLRKMFILPRNLKLPRLDVIEDAGWSVVPVKILKMEE